MLRELWLKSFLAFLIVAGLPRSINHCRLAAYSIGIATATIIVRSLLFGVNDTGRLVIVARRTLESKHALRNLP